MTAAITWAVLATVGAVAVYWLMRRQNRALGRMVNELGGYLDNSSSRYWTLWHAARKIAAARIDAEDRLRKIEQARHLSAKHARAAQLAAKRLQIVGKAAEINREMGR
jgi:hypothetical protein